MRELSGFAISKAPGVPDTGAEAEQKGRYESRYESRYETRAD
jgi:hypothetical protein